MRLSIFSEEDFSRAYFDEKERKAKAAKNNGMSYVLLVLAAAYIGSQSPFALLELAMTWAVGILAIIATGYGMIWHIIENAGEQ